MAAPQKQRSLCAVIVRIVILGKVNRESLAEIPLVFLVERDAVVLRMAEDKDLPSLLRHD